LIYYYFYETVGWHHEGHYVLVLLGTARLVSCLVVSISFT